MDLIAIATELGTEKQCLDFIERMRWPKGVRCPVCGGKEVSKFEVKATTRKVVRKRKGEAPVIDNDVPVPARHLYECLESTCRQQFAATTGTLFHDTHLPLQKWFFAIALMVNAKKGLSARQMKRDLKVTYKTAWYLCHRIREAMQQPGGVFGGQVEMDETYIGGRYDARRHPDNYMKQPVMGVIQRANEIGPSQVRAFPVKNRSKEVIAAAVEQHVANDAQIFTDEWSGYRHLKQTHDHQIVIHSRGEYVRGDVHTNNCELFWGLFKRQIIGQHHFVSVKHLQRYLNESVFKFNNREAESIFLLVLINLLIGTAMPYAKLIEGPKVGPNA